MTKTLKHSKTSGENTPNWLVFFYSMPTKPVKNRVKLWRRLSKAGALQLKGSVYILPYTDSHYEFCQWMVKELSHMNGDASFIKADEVETLSDGELRGLFNAQRSTDYKNLDKKLTALETAINTYIKGTQTQSIKSLHNRLHKIRAEYDELQKIDFFSSEIGRSIMKRLNALNSETKALVPQFAKKPKAASISVMDIADYQGRLWVTRPKPFIDRIASAWLIKKCIDPQATFEFVGDNAFSSLPSNTVTFDMKDSDFTHVGNLCTFEVLMKSFQLKDKRLQKIAETIHQLDIRDDKYRNPEAQGLEDILTGISRTSKDDNETLIKGMSVFDMLYASKG